MNCERQSASEERPPLGKVIPAPRWHTPFTEAESLSQSSELALYVRDRVADRGQGQGQ